LRRQLAWQPVATFVLWRPAKQLQADAFIALLRKLPYRFLMGAKPPAAGRG